MAKQTANIITSVRILCSICLLFCTTFSVGFYAFYLLGGISDMTDGFVARKTNSVSSFGSKLDSVADFVFIISVCIKLFPAVDISKGIWVFMLIILALKIFNVF
ncbi:MAG: CDP-alcohol phosphatidyltransferase family protein, partial [Firmicutes bacterium]|nr:CDP-alcohol phosphatidyltransferase family protein [Bacillota bacterium]